MLRTKLLYLVMTESAFDYIDFCMQALWQTAASAAAVSSQQGNTKPYSMYIVPGLSVNKAANVIKADWNVAVTSLMDD